MTPRLLVRTALQGLADDRVFPVLAEQGVATPYIVFQIVGGDPQELITGEKPEKRQRRVQLNVWSRSSLEAEALAEQAEDALRAATDLQVEILTEAIDTYDEVTNYLGTMQEFYVFC